MARNWLICFATIGTLFGVAHPVLAQSNVTPFTRKAVQTMHDVDANGQAFTLSIAAVGGTGAVALGTWLLHERPVGGHGNPSIGIFSNGLILVGTGIGQFVHGFMRLGERQASAAAARQILDNPNATQQEHLNYLRYRADQSKTTRFVGAVITTVQGLAVLATGLEMALTEDSEYTATGWTLAGLGIVGTGIGAVHFFGKTRAQRELDKALKPETTTASISLSMTPTILRGHGGEAVPALSAFGRF